MFRNNLVPRVITLVFTMAAISCSNTTEDTSGLQSSTKLHAVHRKLISLTPGEYLVKIEKQSNCSTTNLPISQHWEYPDPNEAINPLVELQTVEHEAANTTDNSQCTPGTSTGWTLVQLNQNGALTYDWGQGEITSVELIETNAAKYAASSITLDANSEFIVDSEIESSCRDQKATLSRQNLPAHSQTNPSAMDKTLFTSVIPVTDNLFHRAICRTPTVYSASEYVETASNSMLVTSSGSIETIKKIQARAIIKRTTVFPMQNATSDIEITDADGSRLMTALENLGIVDVDPMIGATNLMVTNLRCQKKKSTTPTKAVCTYTFVNPENSRSQTVQGLYGADAETLFDVLQIHGASIPAGINPQYEAVGARKVLCSRPVIPNPVDTCLISPQ